jgi:AraC-like DNA-binding protein
MIKAWSFPDLLLELYHYAPGPAELLPKHCHEEYQFCLSIDFPGEYYYRGSYYFVPIGSLSIIHPSEVHSARDLDYRQTPATFQMMYVSPTLVKMVAAEVAGCKSNLPFFADPIILDSSLANLFVNFQMALEGMASKLEQDSLLLSVLTQFIMCYADTTPSSKPVGREREAVQRVREYLRDNYAENVTLDRLAQLACLSPYHLSRVFCAEVGVPPHYYQTQVRVERAKAFLSKGMPTKQVAAETGFADQSHLTRHFKRLMQVTPGRYLLQNSKNVLDMLHRAQETTKG